MKIHQPKNYLLIFIFAVIVLGVISNDFKTLLVSSIQMDTVGHAIGFFILTFTINALLKLPLINLSICLTFYAAFTEIGQHYLGFRRGEISDFIADVVGILLFILFHWLKTSNRKKISL